MVGPVANVVELSDEERCFLEGQIRRHKAPRSLPGRYRMILLCADGLPSKAVAAQLGTREWQVEETAGRYHTPLSGMFHTLCRAMDAVTLLLVCAETGLQYRQQGPPALGFAAFGARGARLRCPAI